MNVSKHILLLLLNKERMNKEMIENRVLKVAIIFISGLFLSSCVCSQKNIKSVIEKNPNLIFEVLQEDGRKLLGLIDQAIEKEKEIVFSNQIEAGLKNPKKPLINSSRVFGGNPEAPVTIVEYTNFTCGFCRKANAVIKELLKLYPEQVRVVHKHLPFDDIALEGALYFESIAAQNKELALQFFDKVFESNNVKKDGIERRYDEIAFALDLDLDLLLEDVDSKKFQHIIDEDKKEAKEFGFNGTPSFLINGVAIEGALPLERFQKAINMILEHENVSRETK